MSASAVIRPGTGRDFAAIGALLWPDSPVDGEAEAGFHFDPGGLFVAEQGGELVGMGCVRLRFPRRSAFALVEEIYVHPGHRGSGLGTRLLGALEGAARGRGFRLIAAVCTPQGLGFFRRSGFEVLGEEYPLDWGRYVIKRL